MLLLAALVLDPALSAREPVRRRKKSKKSAPITKPIPKIKSKDPVPDSSSAPEPSAAFRASLTWTTAAGYTGLTEIPANFGNSVLELPDFQALTELKPDLSAEAGKFHIIARPRLRFSILHSTVQGASKSRFESPELLMNELYLQWTPSDYISLAYGLQNFQWGPAESMSPSNRIFHETVQSRDILYAVRGHHLARLNLTPAQDWSLILMGELTENGEESYAADQPFEAKALLKAEHSWNSGADYIGLVGGVRQVAKPWFGEYFNLSPLEGLSLYADASHEQGSRAWYPETRTDLGTGASSLVLAQSQAASTGLYTLAVFGARYTFLGGSDLRFEFVYDGAAYNPAERQLIRQALAPTGGTRLFIDAENLRRLLRPGLEFPGQRFALVSLRVPDFLLERNLSLYTRYMHSLTDQSGQAYATLEYIVGDSGTLFGATGFTHGEPVDELRGFSSYSLLVGYRHAW